jgi:hypothetical protein
MTLLDIATELGVAKSSVSLWVRDVPFTPSKRRYGPRTRPNKLMQRKADEIDEMLEAGRQRIRQLSEREFLMAGAALYAGEGAKRDRLVVFTNSDPRLIVFFLAWFRKFFEIDESRLKLRLYLHEGLDLHATVEFWAATASIPSSRFYKPYRARADASIRTTKHQHGCVGIVYTSARTHREVMGIVRALLTSCDLLPG